MAFNEKLSDRIREALCDVDNVTEKYMFGGVCYMVNSKMCVGVAGDKLMCRIGKSMYNNALEKPGCEEMTFNGKPMNGYVYVNEDGMKNREDFNYWIGLCLKFNPEAKASKK
ncbi:TfoX/Sxy family protein [Dyadobacter psychrotolerans]|uniref:TfoX family protein n=1 Tax=Dyadobacter psychrotolerans TaxID=2541721 RepID=A0A4R5DT57_9BACT|nr:TfoX/Sxy family protein [Dyadobacter psychrotolerans]TDE15564.1 TfoX family protein [Dyadobacter psychrotolerans]